MQAGGPWRGWRVRGAAVAVAVCSAPVDVLLLLTLLVGIGLAPFGVRRPVGWAIALTRRFAHRARRAAGRELGRRVDGGYAAEPTDVAACLRDRRTWLDACWLVVHAAVGTALLTVGFALASTGQQPVLGVGTGVGLSATVLVLTVLVVAVPALAHGYAVLAAVLLGRAAAPAIDGPDRDDTGPGWAPAARLLGITAVACVVALVLLVPALVAIVCAPLLGQGNPVSGRVARAVHTVTDLHRTQAGAVLGRPVPRPYRPHEGRLWDTATLRELLWLAAYAVLGGALLALAYGWYEIGYAIEETFGSDLVTNVVVAVVVVPALATVLVVMAAAIAHGEARLAETLLGAAGTSLEQRLEQLTASRAASLDASAAELRRIERDLHDGAQARLAAVGMTLGLAAQLMRSDPGRAEALLAEARSDARSALSELRDLVRGIHPPVLADRGLVGGLEAVALLCPVPVDVDARLDGRPQAPVESAMYFATAEALANVGKHGAASRVRLHARHADGVLRVTVHDDGVGGADPATGSGLAGIRRRLAAFDGRLTVTSPAGGPTELTMELPCLLTPTPGCVSSSPRITSSSATG